MNCRSDIWFLVIEKNDLLNKKTIETKDLCNLFTEENGYKFYSLILHDKDVDENGELKRPHYHIYLELFNQYAKKSVIGAIAKELRCNIFIIQAKVCESPKKANRYLTHIDYYDKYHYSQDLVVSSNSLKYEDLYNYGSDNDLSVAMLYDLCKRESSLSDIYSIIGLKNALRYRSLINDIFKELKKI